MCGCWGKSCRSAINSILLWNLLLPVWMYFKNMLIMTLLLDWWRKRSHWPQQLRVHLAWSSPPGSYWEHPFPWTPKHSLRQLLSMCNIAQKHNFISSLLAVSGAVMALHCKTQTRVYAGLPEVTCLGPAETGKSTAIRAALFLLGMIFFKYMC